LNQRPLGPCPPFLILSAIEKIEVAPNYYIYGRYLYIWENLRKYNWGICDVKNPQHSDFKLFKYLMISSFSLDLIESTNHYYKKVLII
jgi:septin family protein